MRVGRLSLAVVGLYLVLVGGTELGRLHPELRAVNGVIAGGVILAAILRPWPKPDLVALATVFGLIGFCGAALVAPLPRYTFEAALSAVAYAAAFLLLRTALADSAAYIWARQLLAVGALAFIATFTILWLGVWIEWLNATSFGLWPPLTLPLPTVFIRHPHVVAFTAMLLLPAVWSLHASRAANVVRGIASLAAVFLVLASGSRTVLLAAVIATVAVYGFRWRTRIHLSPRTLVGGGAAVAVVVVAIVATGSSGFLVQRLLTVTTLAARGEIWGATLSGWLDRPFFGFGPGTYPLALPLTGYFDGAMFSPRHADNAVIQLLFEGGAVTLALVLPLVAMVLHRALLTVQRPEARWAVLFLALGSMTDNPTDTVGLIALVIFWAAAGTPPVVAPVLLPFGPHRAPIRMATAMAFAIIAVAWGTITIADFAYAGARRSAGSGQHMTAVGQLELASAFDPSNAFYRRQLGVQRAVQDDLTRAADDLAIAMRLNPADDVTRRSMALVSLELGRELRAATFATQAVRLRASDALNHLVDAHVDIEIGRETQALRSAARAVEVGHWIVAAPGWEQFLLPIDPEKVTAAAADAAEEAGQTLSAQVSDLAWLMGLNGRGSAAADLGADHDDATAESIGLVFDCRLEEALETLEVAVRTEGSQRQYWLVRYIAESILRADTTTTERILVLFSARSESPLHGSDKPADVSPLTDQLRDSYMYDQLPMPTVAGKWNFPDTDRAALRWLREPADAAGDAAPHSALAECLAR